MFQSDNTSKFDRDIKKCKKKHWDMSLLRDAMLAILNSDKEPIPAIYNDHSLVGNHKGHRELHIGGQKSNWLLTYYLEENVIVFVRTGTHDDIL